MTKQNGLIGLAIALAILYPTVWVVGKAWKNSQK